jgi:tetratricopeptide (TPR) repeat protein
VSVGTGNRLKEELIESGWIEEAIVKVGRTRKVLLRLTKKGRAGFGFPQKTVLQIVRAKIALARGDTKSARLHLDAALRACPMSGDALLMLARLQKERGESERALLTLERTSRIESHTRRALLEIARIHSDRSHYREALNALEEAQAIQFDPHVARYAEQIRRAKASQE